MASSKRNGQGHLLVGVTSRQSGRKIDTWNFHPGDVAGGKLERKDPIVFEVCMLHTLEFVVDTKSIPKERWPKPLTGTVLADLHAQALEAARAEFDLAHGLEWSDWLEIRIKETSLYDRRDAVGAGQAHLSYTQIARAEKPDGQAFTVNGNGVLVSFPTPVGVERSPDGLTAQRRLDPDKEARINAKSGIGSASHIGALLGARDSRSADTQFAYLPDTPENRAGLDAIIQAIEGINVRLQDFLQPENIEHTLQRAMASAGRLLAAPEGSSPSQRKPGP